MLIHNKDDIEFVTELPCILGHPVKRCTNGILALSSLHGESLKITLKNPYFLQNLNTTFVPDPHSPAMLYMGVLGVYNSSSNLTQLYINQSTHSSFPETSNVSWIEVENILKISQVKFLIFFFCKIPKLILLNHKYNNLNELRENDNTIC